MTHGSNVDRDAFRCRAHMMPCAVFQGGLRQRNAQQRSESRVPCVSRASSPSCSKSLLCMCEAHKVRSDVSLSLTANIIILTCCRGVHSGNHGVRSGGLLIRCGFAIAAA